MLPIIIATLDDERDRAFMLRVYEEYERLLFRVARQFVAGQPDAEEVVQESLVRLMGKIDTLRPMERCILTAYIVATVRNTAISFLRREGRRQAWQAAYDDGDRSEPEALSLEELTLLAENRRAIAAAWGLLEQRDRVLLEGKYFLGLSDGELARAVGCQKGSVRMLLVRARRNAMELLQDKEVELL